MKTPKPTKENITIGALAAMIATGIYALEDRFVTSDDFETHVMYSEISDLEDRLERLQDKLASILAIPEAERERWERKEIERLRQEIERVRDKIRRLG